MGHSDEVCRKEVDVLHPRYLTTLLNPAMRLRICGLYFHNPHTHTWKCTLLQESVFLSYILLLFITFHLSVNGLSFR
jgi:hypothetical protein